MPPSQPDLKSEVRQALEKLGQVLSGKGGESRCVVVRCADADVVNALLTVVPQAYQRILWEARSMADVQVATELRNIRAAAESGSRVIPLLHTWPGEAAERTLSPDAARGIEEIELEMNLQLYPMVVIVQAPSIRILVNEAKTFWKNKGGYLAWPNLKQAASTIPLQRATDEAGQSAEVSEVLARLQGEKAGAFLIKSAEKETLKGDLAKAREFLMGAVHVYSQVANLGGMAKVYHQLGLNCVALGDLLTASEWFAQAVDNYAVVGDDVALAESYSQKGQAHFARGELDRAAECFRKGLHLYESLGDNAKIAAGKRHIAMVLERIGSYAKAEELYKASLALEQSMENKLGEARVLHHLGRLYDQQSAFDKAMEFYRQSIAIKESINDLPGLATSYHEVGNMLLAQGEAKDALESYDKALEVETRLRDLPGQVKTLAQKGLAELKAARYEEGLRSLALAHYLARKTRSPLASEIVQKIRDIEELMSVDTYNRILREVSDSVRGE